MRSPDDALDIAYDIFLEMAPDNLEFKELTQFEENFDEQGAVVLTEVGSYWLAETGFEATDDEYFEIQLGLADEDGVALDPVLAKILLSKNSEDVSCHVIWVRH